MFTVTDLTEGLTEEQAVEMLGLINKVTAEGGISVLRLEIRVRGYTLWSIDLRMDGKPVLT